MEGSSITTMKQENVFEAGKFEFTFPAHSGFGNQMQQVLAALFLAQETNRTLILPPLLEHRAALDLEHSSLLSGKCRAPDKFHVIDEHKERILNLSEFRHAAICDCMQQGRCDHLIKQGKSRYKVHLQGVLTPGRLGRWGHVFNLSRFPHRERGCNERLLCMPDVASNAHTRRTCALGYDLTGRCPWNVTKPSHSTLHATLLNRRAPAGPVWCNDQKPHCEEQLEMVRRLHRHTSSPLCLGPLNNYFRVEVLEKCARDYPMAHILLNYGLPLNLALRPWQEQFLNSTCDLCAYIRLSDRRKGFASGRNTFVDSVIRVALQHAKSNATRLEVISNCYPFEECQRALQSSLSKTGFDYMLLGDEHQHKAAAAAIANITMLSHANAFLLYDQVRCSRCLHVVPAYDAHQGKLEYAFNASRQQARSSFWDQIDRLHKRFAAGIAYAYL